MNNNTFSLIGRMLPEIGGGIGSIPIMCSNKNYDDEDERNLCVPCTNKGWRH